MTYGIGGCTFAGMATSPSPQLRVKDVVDEYGLTERYLRHLIAASRIPYYKIGKNICFDRADLDAWFAERKVEATN